MKLKLLITTQLLFIFIASFSQNLPNNSNPGEQIAIKKGTYNNNNYGYYQYLPKNFDNSKKYPLLLFYHGIGEKGNGTSELNIILKTGVPALIKGGKHFNAIVISPQSSHGWFDENSFKYLYNFLTAHYPIDKDRVYVTGLSAGGGGTWRALTGYYNKIAAAIPICGANNVPDPSEKLQNTPIWTFHNFIDRKVDKDITIKNVDRIANLGATKSVIKVYPSSGSQVADDNYTMHFNKNAAKWVAKKGVNQPQNKLAFTLYKYTGHDSWTTTYNNQNVWNWLFSQNLNNNTLSTDNIDDSKIKVYQNINHLVIETNDLENKTLKLYNYLAQNIITSQTNTKLITIPKKNITSGIYILHIENSLGKILLTKKIMIH